MEQQRNGQKLMKKATWLPKSLIDELAHIAYVHTLWLQGPSCMDSNNFANPSVPLIFTKFWTVSANHQANTSGLDFLTDIDTSFL